MAGLPGTGLGGLFYGLLIVWMALREPWLARRSTNNRARWGRIGLFGSFLTAIVLLLWLEGLLLLHVIDLLPESARAASSKAQAIALGALAPAAALAPFVILAALIASIHVVRLVLRWSGRPDARANPVPQHHVR